MMSNAIKDLSVSSSSPIRFEVKWHSSWSDKWYWRQSHGFESRECHWEGGIVEGTTFWLFRTTLKIGPTVSYSQEPNKIQNISFIKNPSKPKV